MALKDVGVRLRVEGLSGFKSSMSSAESSISGIGTRLQNLSPQIRQAGLAMAGLGASITAAMGVSVMKAVDFEQAITNAVSVTGYMGDEAEIAKEKMSELARELGTNTKFTASEVANAMYDLASKGFKPAEMSIKELQPFLDLAAATQADLAMTTETVTSTLRAFGLQTTESGRVSDVFAKTIGSSAATIDKLSVSMAYVAPVAKAAGMELEETSAFLGALYNTGLDASMAGTALRGVLAELMDPSNDLTEALDSMGLTLDDVDLSSNSVTQILGKLRKAGMTSQQVMAVFGKRAGPAALSLMGVNEAGVSTIDTIAGLTETLETAGGTAEDMAEMQLDTTEGKLTELKSAFEDLMISIGDQLLPIISSLVETIRSVLIPIGDWIKENPVLTEIIVVFTTALGVLLTSLGAIIVLGPTVAAAFQVMLGPIGLVILAIEAVIVVTVLIIKHWDTISAFFKEVWEVIKGYFQSAWNFIEEWGLYFLGIPGIIIKHWDTVYEFFKGVWDKIWEFFAGFRNQIDKWFVEKIVGFVDDIKEVWGTLVGFFQGVWDGILEAGKTAMNGLIGIINSAIDLVSGKQLLHISKKTVLGKTVFPEVTIKMPTIPKIPLLAAGGNILAGGSAIVGENGPEMLSLPTGATVQPLTTSYEYNITENYARPETPQSLDLTFEALAMYART